MIEIDRKVTITNKLDLSFESRLLGRFENEAAKLEIFSKEISLTDIIGYDFFDCLVRLRHILEERQLFILCQGSAKNVYPSGMAREMSSGLKAYLLELKKKASIEALVDIFDPAPIDDVGLIAEQVSFFNEWVNTPKD